MSARPNELLQRTTRRQRGALGLAVMAAGAGLMWFFDGGEDPVSKTSKGDDRTTRIVADLTRGARAERSWLDISEERFKTMEGRLERLEAERRGLAQDNERLARQNAELSEDANRAIDAQAGEIDRLREELVALRDRPAPPSAPPQGNATRPPMENPFERARNGQPRRPGERDAKLPGPAGSAALVHFDLGEREGGSRALSLYVPAGSYAPARVIGGVDAAVGVNAQADPRPVLFRITGPAVNASLAGDRQTTELTGCLVTGAAFGDLPSEKIYVRLQTMTCSRRPGEAFETEIQGYMAGAGKAGVRGLVVSRESDLVAQAFVAGAVGGISGGVSESLRPPVTTTATTVTTGNRKFADMLKGGLGQGLEQAGDRVSQYLIKRAEQYQPVIVMQAGTEVELVFIKGVSLTPERSAGRAKK